MSESRPVPTTGQILPIIDEATDEHCAKALERYAEIFIPYQRQTAIRSGINTLRLICLEKRGVPGVALPGRALSQVSQAGKTKVLKAYALQMQTTPNSAGVVNPFRVIYFGLEVRLSVKMLCKSVLKLLGDPHYNHGNSDDVRDRLRIFMRERDVELLIIDEVQHLKGKSLDKADITDELKRLLDSGIVPVVFAGNDEAREFFTSNVQLSSRLGTPLELNPLTAKIKDDRKLFRQFCIDLDSAMVDAEVLSRSSNLGQPSILTGLLKSSGGHVGRVCRIVESALEIALRRHADFVEVVDLYEAVESYAIPQGYCSKNAFAC